VKYREQQQLDTMHRLDAQIQKMDADKAAIKKRIADAEAAKAEVPVADKEQLKKVETDIKAREKQLLPLYTSIAVGFADLHDKTGRMKAKNVIREGLSWKDSRRYFYWRVKRRVLEEDVVKQVRKADDRLSHAEALKLVQSWAPAGVAAADKSMVEWLEKKDFKADVEGVRTAFVKAKVEALLGELAQGDRQSLLEALATRK